MPHPFAQVRHAQKPLHELGMHKSADVQCTRASQVCTKACMLLHILGQYVKAYKRYVFCGKFLFCKVIYGKIFVLLAFVFCHMLLMEANAIERKLI